MPLLLCLLSTPLQVMVVFPFKDRSQQSAALRNWDLWGPMIFTLGLAIALSIGAQTASKTFSVGGARVLRFWI